MPQNLAAQIEYGPTVSGTQPDLIVSGQKATSGPLQLIPVPGLGRRIVIDSITLQAEADGDQLCLLSNTAGTVIQRLFVTTKAQGISRTNLFWSVGANLGLTLSLNANLAFGYTIHYHFENV